MEGDYSLENCIKKTTPLQNKENKAPFFPAPETLSLEELVGQLFILRWDAGKESSAEQQLKQIKPGGFILFGGERNTTSTWIQHFQNQSLFPLFIASDMERGVGQQIRGGIEFPSQMTLASTKNISYSYQMGYHTGLQAKSLGVNVLFAPVADVNNNPQNPIIKERSYGSDPEEVSTYCRSYIQGANQARVLSCAKHFPGHGDTTQDSHHTLPVIRKTLEQLRSTELIPFQACIQAQVPMIMTAHILYPTLSKHVATLSSEILTQLLRQELQFDGLLVSDAFTMKGLSDHYSESEAMIRAIRAGIDLILIPQDPENAFHSLLNAVKEGVLERSLIETAVRRVFRLKKEYQIHQIPPYLLETEGQKLSEEIARNSILHEGHPWTMSQTDQFLCFLPSNQPELAGPFLKSMEGRAKTYSSQLDTISPEVIPVIFSETRAYGTPVSSAKMWEDLARCIQVSKRCIWLGYPSSNVPLPPSESMLRTFGTAHVSQIALAELLQKK